MTFPESVRAVAVPDRPEPTRVETATSAETIPPEETDVADDALVFGTEPRVDVAETAFTDETDLVPLWRLACAAAPALPVEPCNVVVDAPVATLALEAESQTRPPAR